MGQESSPRITDGKIDPFSGRNALILNQDSFSCPVNQCGSLLRSLRNHISFREILERNATVSLPEVSFTPDLIILRLPLSAATQKLIDSCRRMWNRAAMIALFCRGSNEPTDDFPYLFGALDDFVSCPFRQSEFILRVRRLLQSKKPISGSPSDEGKHTFHFESIVGDSPNFLRVVEKIPLLANCQTTILISGETGSGKEVIARAIHYQGSRQGKPFIPVNCGALPDHLFENELFGHTKGAFTDASSAEKGLIAEAEGGTLFLDEIDALSQAGQVKLLRFLQDGEYRPVGSARTLIADVRVIAATNTELTKRVESKLFRDDLYYRLNFLSLAIPPLRERIEDVVPFTAHFLGRYAKQNGQAARVFSFGALEKLMAYSWPGNIRELESVITKTLTFSTAPTLEADDIELSSASDEVISRARSLRDAKSRTVQAFERGYLTKLLAKYRGNVTHAAKAAGKERRTFQRLLRKHNLSRHSFIA
jgi:DNA-binding NtrC family response regulator